MPQVSAPPPAATGIFYVHADHLGTPKAATDAAQGIAWAADYLPYGEAQVAVEAVTLNVRFPGQYFDAETGLAYNYFRYYDASVARYASPDPSGLIRNPIALELPGATYLLGPLNHLYGYVDNAPVIAIDPLGLRRGKVYDITRDVWMFWWSAAFRQECATTPGACGDFHTLYEMIWTAEAADTCIFDDFETEIVNGPRQYFLTHVQWWQVTHTRWLYESSDPNYPCTLSDYRVETKETYFPHPGSETLNNGD